MTKVKKINLNNLFFLLSFLLPFLIFLTYFLCRQGQILTVDLGQQYIDFLAYLKTSLFSNPLGLIYSFNQGLGGSFVGTFAYYLASPFNWLIFILPLKFLPQAVLLIISLKIGSIGLSSYYLWQQYFTHTNKLYALSTSLAYALCGYVIAYNLNLMWLDSLILLPLLIDSINHIILLDLKSFIYLTIITFLIWITNFYTGYMVLLFGLLYFISQLIIKKAKTIPLASYLKPYLLGSIFGSLSASFLLFPTFIELLGGKGQATTNWNLDFSYKIDQLPAKLAGGTYSFHEMSDGLPNIYLAITLLFLVVAYFLSKKITLKAKIINGIFLVFLIFSLTFNPLILLWHLGQYPVWYPARMSFLLVFFILNMDIQLLRHLDQFSWLQKIIILILGIGFITYLFLIKNKLEFLTPVKIIITTIFIICSLLLYFFFHNKWSKIMLFGLVIFEVTINLIMSLDSISYQNNNHYTNFTLNMRQATNWTQQDDTHLYRIEKDFTHTDNDPFSDNYFGLSNFNSISNKKVLTLVDYLGLKNNDNSFSSQYSSLLTDSILGVKYYILPRTNRFFIQNNSQIQFNDYYPRLDLYNTKFVKNFPQLQIRKNSTAFPFIFLSNPDSSKINFLSSDPTGNQTSLFNTITSQQSHLYSLLPWPSNVKLHNAKSTGLLQFQKLASSQSSTISFNFVPQSNDPYYLELDSTLDSSNVSLEINKRYIDNQDLGSSSKLIPLATNQKNKNIKIKFKLHNSSLDLNNCRIWQFNQKTFFNETKKYLKKQPIVYQTTPLSLNLKTYLDHSQNVNSTIPYSHNWIVLDNGKLTKTHYFANTFLSFKLEKGSHRIQLIYIPFALLIGILVSTISIIIFLYLIKK